jgi:hypothetical protein
MEKGCIRERERERKRKRGGGGGEGGGGVHLGLCQCQNLGHVPHHLATYSLLLIPQKTKSIVVKPVTNKTYFVDSSDQMHHAFPFCVW